MCYIKGKSVANGPNGTKGPKGPIGRGQLYRNQIKAMKGKRSKANYGYKQREAYHPINKIKRRIRKKLVLKS